MSLLAELRPAEGSKHYSKRVGRGRGSGLGQTSGKGNKGQLARTGGKVRRGFEGGQTPLIRRLPKFGFSNVAFANRFEIINISQLEKYEGVVTIEKMIADGLARKARIKILGRGELTKKLKVQGHKFSESAKKAIENLGGTVEVVK